LRSKHKGNKTVWKQDKRLWEGKGYSQDGSGEKEITCVASKGRGANLGHSVGTCSLQKDFGKRERFGSFTKRVTWSPSSITGVSGGKRAARGKGEWPATEPKGKIPCLQASGISRRGWGEKEKEKNYEK